MIQLSDIYGLLSQAGVPVTYKHFTGNREDIPDPPYIAWYEADSKNFGADNRVYAECPTVIAELYTDSFRNLALERKIKNILTENGIFYETSHADIEDEDIHIVYFEFRLING